MRTGSAYSNAILEMFKHSIRNQKLCVLRPAIASLGELYFFFSQRLAVCGVFILFIGRTIADVAIHNDQRGTFLGFFESVEGLRQHFNIVCISHMNNVPSVRLEALFRVLAVRPIRWPIER